MRKFENTVIVTDLDGTFLNDREGVVPRNVEAVEYFKANGGKFTVATGRVALHALGAIPALAELVNMPIIACNGAYLYDIQNERVYNTMPMAHELAVGIVEFIRESFPSVGIRAGAHEYCFLCTPEDVAHPLIARDLERYKDQTCLVAPLSEWERLPVLKLALRGDGEVLAELAPALEERFGGRISQSKSWPTTIDVLAYGVNKGVPLDGYIRAQMPKGTEIYACGDYINDTEMLCAADVAVCPSGAHEKIKKMCDLCLCSHNEGLIAELVEYIDKNKE